MEGDRLAVRTVRGRWTEPLGFRALESGGNRGDRIDGCSERRMDVRCRGCDRAFDADRADHAINRTERGTMMREMEGIIALQVRQAHREPARHRLSLAQVRSLGASARDL